MNHTVFFREVQHMHGVLLWAGLVLAHAVLIVLIGWLFAKKQLKAKPAVWILVILEAGLLVLSVVVWNSTLVTSIRQDAIYVQFTPFESYEHRYAWENVQQCYVRRYNPLKEYNGWGVKGRKGYGNALNVSGNMGIQLVLVDGSKMLIGTQQPAEATAVLHQLGHWKEN